MLRLRLTIDAQPRWKKGQPPQRTTGVARTNSIQASSLGANGVPEGMLPQHGGHRHDDQRRRQRQADPKSPRHEAEFRVGFLFPRDGKGFERHAALGTRAGAALADFRVHRAGVNGAGIRCLRRDAARRAGREKLRGWPGIVPGKIRYKNRIAGPGIDRNPLRLRVLLPCRIQDQSRDHTSNRYYASLAQSDK